MSEARELVNRNVLLDTTTTTSTANSSTINTSTSSTTTLSNATINTNASTSSISQDTDVNTVSQRHEFVDQVLNFVRAVLPGSLGGAARVLTGQPFDTVKIRLQIQEYDSKGVGLQYANSSDCLRKIIKQEGTLALYRGSLAPLVGNIILLSVHFPVFSYMMKEMNKLNQEQGVALKDKGFLGFFKQIYLSGAAAGLAGSLISTPVEHVRIKVQMKGSPYKGSVQCFKSILTSSPFNLYKGFGITALRDLQGYGFFFYAYEVALRAFKGDDEYFAKTPTKPIHALASGVVAGFGLWGSMFPLDVIKSKIQADSLVNPRYKNSLDCAKVIYQNDGIKGFWRGITPTLIRAIPVNAAIFLTVETSRALLLKL